MRTKEELENLTKKFFGRHWGMQKEPPTWNFSWNWCNAVPNHDLGGIYALFSGELLVYIGLGASRGGGKYKDHGISRRLLAHVLRTSPPGSNVSYLPQDRWQNVSVNLVATLGFPPELTYLACALEDYLIGELDPPENRMKRNSKSDDSTLHPKPGERG